MGKAYRPGGKPNKREMPRRQGPYTVVRKISPLAYKLDIPAYTKVHPMISVAYFSRYRTYEDPYHRVAPPLGPVECGSDSETSADEARDGQHWELERIVDHRTGRNGITKYLVRWKGYGPQEDSWKDARQLKHARRLLAEYEERRRRVEEIGGARPRKPRKADQNA